jgi:hypothetical protein
MYELQKIKCEVEKRLVSHSESQKEEESQKGEKQVSFILELE